MTTFFLLPTSAIILWLPLWHGTVGAWDEVIFAVGFVISVVIFIMISLSDKKRGEKKEEKTNDKDT